MKIPKHRYLKELFDSDDPYWLFDQDEKDLKEDSNYQSTGIHYSEIWNLDAESLAWVYEHLRYYKGYTSTMLYPSYDKGTGEKQKPNMVEYKGQEYYIGSLIDILLDKIRYYFKHDPIEFIKYKYAYIKGHEGEPKQSFNLTEGERKYWQSKGLFRSDKAGTVEVTNPHTYSMERTDQVGLFKYKQYTSDIWDIWKALWPSLWD
ncbi:hypothetical protein ACFQ22_02135 [Lentilactobacillus raoultii]|uniref:Uncharacterized protein n=1 Tax=Lentilactobacillus raoultii TaxID=1987503 RepID=A0ABW3PJM8_9LACO|nr:hypothetical protein [Lentilactobacillus raoultii]